MEIFPNHTESTHAGQLFLCHATPIVEHQDPLGSFQDILPESCPKTLTGSRVQISIRLPQITAFPLIEATTIFVSTEPFIAGPDAYIAANHAALTFMISSIESPTHCPPFTARTPDISEVVKVKPWASELVWMGKRCGHPAQDSVFITPNVRKNSATAGCWRIVRILVGGIGVDVVSRLTVGIVSAVLMMRDANIVVAGTWRVGGEPLKIGA